MRITTLILWHSQLSLTLSHESGRYLLYNGFTLHSHTTQKYKPNECDKETEQFYVEILHKWNLAAAKNAATKNMVTKCVLDKA